MKKVLFILTLISFIVLSCEDNAENSSTGVLSGSYANMLTVGHHLYIVSDSELITYTIANGSQPEEIDRKFLDFGVESMFIRGNILFIGSRTAMYIYRSGSNGIPTEISTTQYINFNGLCLNDPIVANDTIAFATLSTTISTACFRDVINELRLYDIEDLSTPIQINEFQMDEPKGLGLDDNWLFVCEANNGLKVIDISDPLQLSQKHHFPGFQAYDVIPNNGLLLVVGPDSLYQFDYSDMDQMHRLSAIDL